MNEPLACGLCHLYYLDTKGRAPRVLACGHSFCSTCVKREPAFRCPYCFASHKIGKNEVPTPKNYALAALAASVLSRVTASSDNCDNSAAPCLGIVTRCDNCGVRHAVFKCEQCSAVLCAGCDAEIHANRIFAAHTRARIPDAVALASVQGTTPVAALAQTPLLQLLECCAGLPNIPAGDGADKDDEARMNAALCLSCAPQLAEQAAQCRQWLASSCAAEASHATALAAGAIDTLFAALRQRLAERDARLHSALQDHSAHAVARCAKQTAGIERAQAVLAKAEETGSLDESDAALVDGACNALPLWATTVRASSAGTDAFADALSKDIVSTGLEYCPELSGVELTVTAQPPASVALAMQLKAANRRISQGAKIELEVQQKEVGEDKKAYSVVYRGRATQVVVPESGSNALARCYRARAVCGDRTGPWSPPAFLFLGGAVA